MRYSERYDMDDILEVVAWMTEKYTSKESTSVSVERARQFMEAVFYCIDELDENSTFSLADKKGLSAFQAYQQGYNLVMQKVETAQKKYEQLLAIFSDYRNENLRDTVQTGLLGFFKYYDPRFEPQNSILTLDYPVYEINRDKKGIDLIIDYIDAIYLEQLFLNQFSKELIIQILSQYDTQYEKQFINICSYVSRTVLVSSFLKHMETKAQITNSYELLWEVLQRYSKQELYHLFLEYIHFLVQSKYQKNGKLESYLVLDLEDLLVRLKQVTEVKYLKNVVVLFLEV